VKTGDLPSRRLTAGHAGTSLSHSSAVMDLAYPPGEAVGNETSAAGEHAVKAIGTALWLSVLTQKVAIINNIELPLFIALGCIAYLLSRGLARIDLIRAICFLGLMSLIIVTQVAPLAGFRSTVSYNAILLAAVMYSMFIFTVPLDQGAVRTLMEKFQTIGLFIAGLVFLQWAMQLVGIKPFSLEWFMPKQIVFYNYNYVQPIRWGSPYDKPNAIFMLEASHTSQFIAMSLALEICVFQRLKRILFLGAALLSVFAGTGILLVIIAAPVIMTYFGSRLLVAALVVAPIILLGAYFAGMLDYFISRANEFNMQGTSGSGRFVETYSFMARVVSSGDIAAVLGVGAGNWESLGGTTRTIVLNPITKMVVEFGIPVALVWFLFVHLCVGISAAPFIMSVVLLIQYDFLNGSLLVPIHVVYCYFLAGAIVPAATGAHPLRREPHQFSPGSL
jgi:hypothetical protein